jgi:serine/threonine protein phosphatase PrpC
MHYLPASAQHIGSRRYQQDSFGFADPEDQVFLAHGGFLAVLCDGMGGMQHGDLASRAAVRAFLEAYQRKQPPETIPAALERSIHEANRQVRELAQSLRKPEGIGTTLVAAVVYKTGLYYISAGDSAIFHCVAGQFRMMNRPHVFANILDGAVARGALSREDAENHPERHSLTSYIGIEELDEIDRNVEPFPLGVGDTILLASDGMFKTLSDDEIRGCFVGHPQSWPEALVSRTMGKKREHQDNVTVLSVTLESGERRTQLAPPEAAPSPSAAVKPAWAQRILLALIALAVVLAAWWFFEH